jgi:hypothetical protein
VLLVAHDLRREPLEVCKATLACILAKTAPGCCAFRKTGVVIYRRAAAEGAPCRGGGTPICSATKRVACMTFFPP